MVVMAKKDKSFGVKLKERRTSLGLLQSEAAAKLEVSLRTYQNWEQGRSKPSPLAIRLIEQVFGKIE